MKCNACIPIERIKKAERNEVYDVIEKNNHLILFGRSDDPFHAFYTYYYCPTCFAIYEVGYQCSFGNDYHTLECINDRNYFKDHHSELEWLAGWLDTEKRKEDMVNLIRASKTPLTVYKIVSNALWGDKTSELTRIKKKGYSSTFNENIYNANLYVSLNDLFERYAYGFQYFQNAAVLKFEIDPAKFNVHTQPTEYGDWFIPHTKEHVRPEQISIVDVIQETEVPLLSDGGKIGFTKEEYDWFEEKSKMAKSKIDYSNKSMFLQQMKEHWGII